MRPHALARSMLGFGLALSALLHGAACVAAPVPTPSLSPAPLVRAVVRSDPAVAMAGVALFIDAGLVRQRAAKPGLAALTAQAVVETPVDGVPLRDAVEAVGASLDAATGPERVRFYLEGPPAALASAARLVARALGAPSFAAATLAAARADLDARREETERDPRAVGVEVLRGSYYREAAATPPLGTPAALAALSPDDLRAFYRAWYVRGGAAIGAVGAPGDAIDAAVAVLGGALAPGNVAPAHVEARPLAAKPKEIVTHRDVVAPYVVAGFAAPALGDRDFPAVLVVRAAIESLLDAPGAVTRPIPLRAVGSIYAYDVAPAHLAVWLNGLRRDPAVGLAALAAVLKAAAEKPLDAAVLARYKERAAGAWSVGSLSLDARAYAIGSAVARGLDPDIEAQVPAAVRAVTAADVRRVAQRWFQRFDVALVLPRDAGQ